MHKIITDQLIDCVQGKIITDFKHEQFFDGERPLTYTISFENIEYIKGACVEKANAARLILDNGYTIKFGYDSGGLRYYKNKSQIEVMKMDKKFITGGFLFLFTFDDDSCLVLTINSWTGLFKVALQTDVKQSDKLDPTDKDSFTLDNFKKYFHVNIAVIAVCVTTKGCLEIDRGAIHEALYHTKIHPKTKASSLTDYEVEALFGAIKDVVFKILSSGGIKGFIDLFGNHGNYTYSISSKSVGKACLDCGAQIEKGNAFASSIFVCPGCQIQK